MSPTTSPRRRRPRGTRARRWRSRDPREVLEEEVPPTAPASEPRPRTTHRSDSGGSGSARSRTPPASTTPRTGPGSSRPRPSRRRGSSRVASTRGPGPAARRPWPGHERQARRGSRHRIRHVTAGRVGRREPTIHPRAPGAADQEAELRAEGAPPSRGRTHLGGRRDAQVLGPRLAGQSRRRHDCDRRTQPPNHDRPSTSPREIARLAPARIVVCSSEDPGGAASRRHRGPRHRCPGFAGRRGRPRGYVMRRSV